MSPNPDIQVASYLLQNPNLYSSLLANIKLPFTTKMVSAAWSMVNHCYKRRGDFPTHAACRELILASPKVKSKPEEIINSLLETVDLIYTAPPQAHSNREVVLSRILEVCQYQLKGKIDEFTVENLDEAVLDVVHEITRLQSFLADDGGDDDWVLPISDDYLSNPIERLDQIKGDLVPTGIEPLDYMMAGGPRRGDSMMIIGLTNHGKSLLVNTFQNNNIRQGFRVAQFALEATKGDVLSKAWAEFSGVGIEDDKIKGEFALRLQRNIRSDWRSNLAVRVWPRDSRTIDDCRRALEKLIQRHIQRDARAGVDTVQSDGKLMAVYIDHLECLAPKNRVKEDWLNSGNAASAVDALAKEFNVFCMTPTQAKLSGTSLEIIDMTQASRAWGKNHPMTFVGGLCRTALELQQGTGRLYIDKAKRTKCHYLVPLRVDKDLQRVTATGPAYYPGLEPDAPKKKLRGKPVEMGKPSRDFPKEGPPPTTKKGMKRYEQDEPTEPSGFK